YSPLMRLAILVNDTPALHDALPILSADVVSALAMSASPNDLYLGATSWIFPCSSSTKKSLTVGSTFSLMSSLGRQASKPLVYGRPEEHTSELQSREKIVCRLPLEKK